MLKSGEKVAVAATRSFEPQFDQALEIVAVHSVRGQFRRHDRPEGLTVHQNANGEFGDSRRSTRSRGRLLIRHEGAGECRPARPLRREAAGPMA